MNKNISDSAWCDDKTNCKTNGQFDNAKGPLTANETLTAKTTGWTKITDKTKITLPTAYQIAAASGKKIDNATNISDLPEWLFDYLNGNYYTVHQDDDFGTEAYWTSTPISNYGMKVWVVLSDGNSNAGGFPIDYPYHGVRPVITISKSQLG